MTSNLNSKIKIESLKDLCENVANSPVNNRIYSVHNVQNEFQLKNSNEYQTFKLERPTVTVSGKLKFANLLTSSFTF